LDFRDLRALDTLDTVELLLVVEGQQLLPVDRDLPGGGDADADLVAVDVDDRDPDVVADADLLTDLAGQDEHGHLLDGGWGSVRIFIITDGAG
jgi:hypothetical protein